MVQARLLVRYLVLLLLLLTLVQYFPPIKHSIEPVGATSLTALSIWSPTYTARAIVNSSIPTNSFVPLKVNVSNSPILNAFDITVRWDPAILNGVDVSTRGGIFDKPDFTVFIQEVTTDHVRLSGVFSRGSTVSGSGMVFSFTLKVVGVGSAVVNLDESVSLLLLTNTSAPYVDLDGFFSNAAGTGDLMLTSVALSGETITLGDSVTIKVGLRNMGSPQMDNVEVRVFANTIAINSTALGSMAANTNLTLIMNWNTSGLTPGVYNLNATVTTTSPDAFLGDNTIALQSVRLVIHDLAVASLKSASIFVLINQTLDLTSISTNLGTIEDLAVVSILANNTLVKIAGTGATSLTAQVQPGANQTLLFTWDTRSLIDIVSGATPTLNNPLETDAKIRYLDAPANGTVLRTDAKIKYVDANSNNAWDFGETAVYDSNSNGSYDNGEPVVVGVTPSIGTGLKSDPLIKFVDTNHDTSWGPPETVVYDSKNTSLNLYEAGEPVMAGGNGVWDEGESLIYDSNNNGAYETGETLIAGATPSIGQFLRDDPKIKYVDSNGDNVWTTSEPVVYDSNDNSIYDLGLGRYFLKARVKVVSGERDVANNEMSAGAVRICSKLPCLEHDLAIVGSSLPADSIVIGLSRNLTITVRNNGIFSENYALRFFLTRQSFNSTVKEFSGTLPAFTQNNVTHSLTWDTRSYQPGVYNLTARVFTALTVDEEPSNDKVYSTLRLDYKRPPSALFEIDPRISQLGATVAFNATESADPEQGIGFRIGSFSWNFGDGSDIQTCVVTPTQKCSLTTHVYAAPGNYTVTLTVRSKIEGAICDFVGCEGSLQKTLRVNTPPQASFIHNPENLQPGVAVSFDASASTDSDGTIASYTWDFGDGSTGTGKTVEHTYSSPGTYQVKLTVADNDGGEREFTVTLNVNAPSLELLYVGAIGAAAVSLAGALVFLIRRRSRRSSSREAA